MAPLCDAKLVARWLFLRNAADKVGTAHVRRATARIWHASGVPKRLRLLRRQGVFDDASQLVRANSPWYAVSMTVHMVVLTVAMLVLGHWYLDSAASTPGFVPVDDDLSLSRQLTHLDMNDAARRWTKARWTSKRCCTGSGWRFPPNITTPPKNSATVAAASWVAPDPMAGRRICGQRRRRRPEAASIAAASAVGKGFGTEPGAGGAGSGYGGRGSGSRRALTAMYGGHWNTELAVIAAASIGWPGTAGASGSWSLSRFNSHCVGLGPQCSGPGTVESDVAATSLALVAVSGRWRNAQDERPIPRSGQSGTVLVDETANGRWRSFRQSRNIRCTPTPWPRSRSAKHYGMTETPRSATSHSGP